MKDIDDLKSIDDVEARAREIGSRTDCIVIFSRYSEVYLEVHLDNQVKLLDQDSCTGKTCMMEALAALIENRADTVEITNINLDKVRVLSHPRELRPDEEATFLFMDRGNILKEHEVKILNKFLQGKTALIMVARATPGVRSEIPAWKTGFETRIIDGMDCFFIT